MADITKTIKPGGGGDYADLVTWEDAADAVTEISGDVWHAECYTGGDLGAVTISGWALTPTASKYARIYAATGEEHGGDKTAGARIDGGGTAVTVNENFTRIEGIRIDSSGNGIVPAVAIGDVTVDSVLFNACTGNNVWLRVINSADTSHTIKNCLFIDPGYGIRAQCAATTAGTRTLTIDIYHNTIYAATQDGIELDETSTSGTAVLNVNIRNNISMASTTDDYDDVLIGGRNGTITSSNNCSSDTTASVWGGSNHIESQTDTSIFEDPVNDDYTLKSGSNAIDAGFDLSGTVDEDIVDQSRPQGSDHDMGCFEADAVVSADIIAATINEQITMVPRGRPRPVPYSHLKRDNYATPWVAC